MHTGKQDHRGKVCGQAFVLTTENSLLTPEQRVLMGRLLLETSGIGDQRCRNLA
jgi:hypothetical protein